jgi:hypothetical protein
MITLKTDQGTLKLSIFGDTKWELDTMGDSLNHQFPHGSMPSLDYFLGDHEV